MIDNIHWLGHDTFKIEGEKVIYTDPFQVKKEGAADIILITHSHRDHCSPEDIEKIQGPDTIIVATPDCADKLSGDVRTMRPWDKITAGGMEIEAVPAYNKDKPFHPKENGWVGYIFTMNGRRIYLAGDTDHIPEMKAINADIAFLPVSGTYVMTAQEAVLAALDIEPTTVIPMHYNSVIGTERDALEFALELKGKIAVRVLKQE